MDDLLKKMLGIGQNVVTNVKNFATNAVKGIELNPIKQQQRNRQVINNVLDKPIGVNGMSIRGAYRATAPTISQDFGNLYRTAPSKFVPEKARPYVQPIANIIANTAQTIGSGVKDIVHSVGNVITRPQTVSSIIKNTATGAYGGAKIVTAGKPIFQGANLATQLPTQNKIVPRFTAGFMRGMTGDENLAPDVASKPVDLNIGNFKLSFDPIEGVGKMVGFIKNPINSKIIKATEGLNIPLSSPVVNFLAKNATEGGIQNVLMNIKDMPDNLSPGEKAGWISKEFGIGSVMQIGGATVSKGAEAIAKAPILSQVFDEIKRAIGKPTSADIAAATAKVTDVPGQPRTDGGLYDFKPKAEPIMPSSPEAKIPVRELKTTGDIPPGTDINNLPSGSKITFDQRYGKRIAKSGKSAYGMIAGVTVEKDENGKIVKIGFDPEKALLGIAAAGFLTTKGHQADFADIISKSKTQEQAVDGVTSALDFKLDDLTGKIASGEKNAINDAKGLRAAINKTMYELAGVDPAAGKNQAAVFSVNKTDPEIANLIDTLQGYVGKVDDLLATKAPVSPAVAPVIGKTTTTPFYRGEGNPSPVGGSTMGKGIYTTPDQTMASQYGKVRPAITTEIPQNPMKIDGYKNLTKIMSDAADSGKPMEEYIKSQGFDGAQVVENGKVVEQVKFEETPIKSIIDETVKPGEIVKAPETGVVAKPIEVPAIVQPNTPELQTPPQGEITKTGGALPAGEVPPSGPEKQGVSFLNTINSKLHSLYTNAIDRFHPLTELSKKTKDTEDLQNMRWAVTSHYGAGSIANYHVNFELKPILNEVDNVDNLRQAAIAMRDVELAGRGIKGSSEQKAAMDNLKALQEQLGPEKMAEYGATLKKLYDYQDGMVKNYLVKTGIMSQKSYDAMKAKNQFYVPFQRVMDEVDEFLGMTPQSRGAGSVSGQDVIKGIKGSERAIQDPIESIVENTYKIVGLAKRQEVAQTIVNLKDKLPEGTITKIKGPVGNKPNIALFENGKVQHYTAPFDVVESARGLKEEALNNVVKWMSVPTQWFRATATGINPEFAIPNTFRDLQTAFVNFGLNPLGFVRGMSHLMKQDEVYQEFLKSGAQTSRVALDRPFLKQTVESMTSKTGFTIKSPKDLIGILQTMGEYSEQPTRIAVWEKAYKDGIKNGLDVESALKDAALKSQEVTTNFARRGADTQSINAIYAFVNARAQGVDMLLRSFKNNPKGVGTRLALLTVAPALALYAHNNSYESYSDPRIISPTDKQNNFIFMLSDKPIEALGGAQYLKIPKGDVGKLANPIEAYLDFSLGKGGNVADTVLQTLAAFSPIDIGTPNQAAGAVIPTAVKPLVEAGVNKNFFYGTPLVPEYKQNYPAGYQDNNSTSSLFRFLGQKLNISPAKLQNTVEGYGTGWVRIVEMLANKVMPKEYTTQKNLAGAAVNTTPVVRRFLGGEKRSVEEQMQMDKSSGERLKTDISTVRNAIKNGKIPYDAGMAQIQKLQDEANKGTGIGGSPYGVAGDKTSNMAPTDESVARYAQLYQFDKYLSDGPTSGIEKYDFTANKLGEAKKIYEGSGDYANIPEADRKTILEKGFKLNYDAVQYDSMASRSNDIKTQYLTEELGNQSHTMVMQELIKGRVPSISGSLLVSNTVVDGLRDAGIISADEAKALKKLKYDKTGQRVSTTGSGGLTTAQKKAAINKAFNAFPKLGGGTAVDNIIKNTKYATRKESGFSVTPELSTAPVASVKENIPTIDNLLKNMKMPTATATIQHLSGGGSAMKAPTTLSKSLYRTA